MSHHVSHPGCLFPIELGQYPQILDLVISRSEDMIEHVCIDEFYAWVNIP